MFRPIVIFLATKKSPAAQTAVDRVNAIAGDAILSTGRWGYGVRIRQAFTGAAARGATHAVVLDLARRHSMDDLPVLLDAARAQPDAIISAAPAAPVGWTAPLWKAARAHCDFWVWTQCGLWVTDSGQGYRVYPLARVCEIATGSIGREFDPEILVKADWLSVPIKTVALPHDAAALVSVCTPLQGVLYTWRMTLLVLQRMALADSFLDALFRRDANESTLTRLKQVCRETLQHHAARPIAFAAALGTGTFIGVLPAWGIQMALAAGAAHLLRISKRLTMSASAAASPISIPIMVYGGVLIARAIRAASGVGESAATQTAGQYAVIAAIIAVMAGLVVFSAALLAVLTVKRLQKQAA